MSFKKSMKSSNRSTSAEGEEAESSRMSWCKQKQKARSPCLVLRKGILSKLVLKRMISKIE